MVSQEKKDEIIKRRDELYEDYGNSEYDEVKINEILRDEFDEEDYGDELEELGINYNEDELGLEYTSEDENIEGSTEGKENILRLMFVNNKHVYKIYLDLMGYKEEGGKLVYRGKSLIPEKDIVFMIKTIGTLYQPQSLSGDLKKDVKEFDDHYNTILTNFIDRLSQYTDDVCSAKELRSIADIFLTEVLTVRYAIKNGRLGNLTRDTANNSYTEKEDISSSDVKLDDIRKKLGI